MSSNPSPQERLAALIGGEVTGPSTIAVGELRVVTYPTGQVYILRRPHEERGPYLGTFSDGVEALAAAFEQATSEACS